MGTSGFGTLQQTRAAVSWCVILICFGCLFEQCSSCKLYICAHFSVAFWIWFKRKFIIS
jgi:hypothetical protein